MAASPSVLRHPLTLGVALAVAGLVATAFLTLAQMRENEALAQQRFEQRADAFSDALKRRLESYTEIAFGLRGLFVANPGLSRREFVQAIERLDIGNRHPEIKNLAFTRYVRAADKAAFEQRVRNDTSIEPHGYPQFSIRPPGDRAEYFVADYLWPMTGNQGIHGLDISAQPANLASMRYSQKSGQPVASGPFDLLQESTRRTGFVIRVPVFRHHKDEALVTHPPDFLGAVAVTLRVWDVMERMRGEGSLVDLDLYLSDRGGDYAGQNFAVNLPLYVQFSQEDPAVNPAYRRELTIFGRKWRVEMRPAQSFLSATEQRAPLWAGLAGSLLSVLAGAVLWGLASRHSRKAAQAPDPT